MKIIRTSSLSLQNSTKYKLNQLDLILTEYKRLVNEYINLYKDNKILLNRPTDKLETWFSVRLMRKAATQAVRIIKSCRQKDKELRYKKYKKVYTYFKKKNRQLKFLDKKFSEFNLKRKIKPIFEGNVMDLDKDIVTILSAEHNSFDMWFKMNCIGNKLKLVFPCKLHKHFKKYKTWNQLSGCRLRKTNNKWYIDCFFEKEVNIKQGSKGLGLDLGINKLISTSENKQYGVDFKILLQKLDKKQYKSKNSRKLRTKIKQYINYEVGKLPIDYDIFVLENLKCIQIDTKKSKRVNKTTRKYLSRWNLGELHKAIENKCQLNGIQLVYINPKYTSRTCPKCQTVDKKNRSGEHFKCINCGYEENADMNASHNILQRFYQERFKPIQSLILKNV